MQANYGNAARRAVKFPRQKQSVTMASWETITPQLQKLSFQMPQNSPQETRNIVLRTESAAARRGRQKFAARVHVEVAINLYIVCAESRICEKSGFDGFVKTCHTKSYIMNIIDILQN